MISLPIDPYLPQITALWKKERITIISASPGSGKTTRLPWALAQETDKKIIVLEPRKLAAKMAAQRMGQENGVTLGEEVGYAYRDDIRFNKNSKIIFFTEGTFLRFIEQEEFFESIDTVIFDEFHERHLETDLCLALLRNKMEKYSKIKITLMSATISHELAESLNAAIIEIKATLFEVVLHYLPNQTSILNQELAVKVRNVIRDLPAVGDILVFLPGMREILKTQDLLKENFGTTYILHSESDKSVQEEIMEYSLERKIILSTNIAESSLTIPGIRYVIDSGLARVSEFNQWTGIKVLVDRPITQSSAVQRMYRAGRTQEGECFRLYSEFDFNQREKFTIPEILITDLNDTYLISSYYKHRLLWLTPPPVEKWKQAKILNELLGMTYDDEIREVGQFALSYNLNIRLARILWEARRSDPSEKFRIIQYLAQNILKDDSKYLQRSLKSYLNKKESGTVIEFEKIILTGMIDQVAKYRSEKNDFIHYSGHILKGHSKLRDLEDGLYILTSINHRMQVEEVLEIEEDWPIEIEPFPLREVSELNWQDKGITLKSKTSLGSIILEEEAKLKNWCDLTPSQKNDFLHKNQHRFEVLLEEFRSTTTFKRAQFFCKSHNKEYVFNPNFEKFLEVTNGAKFDSEIYLKQILEEELGISIDREVPLFIKLNNKDFPINYSEEASIEGFIQDFYGLRTTPTIMKNVQLTLIILGPHKRAIQHTKSLSSFWAGTYRDLMKEWKREYPRHHWADDPANAPAILLKRQLS